MKTNTSIKRFFGISALLFAVLFIAPACESDATENSEDTPTEQSDEEESSILEERTAFWQEWIDKCFPNEDWSTTTFTTNGINYDDFKANNPEVWQAMIDMYQTPEDGEKYLPGVINSGATNPMKVNAYAGMKLYKLVPAEKNIQGPSPYYITETQLESLKLHPEALEQKLGLPLSSVSGEYWIYSMTSLVDDNIYFQSSIASTDQYANATPDVVYKTPGGAVQSLVINNVDISKWKKSEVPDEKYIPDTLPKVE